MIVPGVVNRLLIAVSPFVPQALYMRFISRRWADGMATRSTASDDRGGLHRMKRPPMSSELRGRTIVVTGATSGIGREVARHLSGRGATVLGVGRDRDRCRGFRAGNPILHGKHGHHVPDGGPVGTDGDPGRGGGNRAGAVR